MEEIEAGSIQLELKYCERCGGLWLRPKGSDLVFCASCAVAMAGFARRARFVNRQLSSAEVDSAFWSEGGNA